MKTSCTKGKVSHGVFAASTRSFCNLNQPFKKTLNPLKFLPTVSPLKYGFGKNILYNAALHNTANINAEDQFLLHSSAVSSSKRNHKSFPKLRPALPPSRKI